MAHDHAHDDDEEHEHDHPAVAFVGSDVEERTLGDLRLLHPALADSLILCQRFASLSDAEKALLAEAQRHVEAFELWTPGYHAPGDLCAACGSPVLPLFTDKFGDHAKPLAYAPFVADVPVHARAECLQGILPKLGRRAPQQLDRLRREFSTVRDRPSAKLSQFFRHDYLTQPPFGLEDWANSVSEANSHKLDKSAMRDIEKLISYVHGKIFH